MLRSRPCTLLVAWLALVLAPAVLAAGPPGGVGPGSGHGRPARGVSGGADLQRQTSVAHTQITESPSTHARGTWWGEVGIVGYSRDTADSLRSENIEYAPVGVGHAFSDRFEVTATATSHSVDRQRDLASDVLTRDRAGAALGLHAKWRWFGSDSAAWSLGTTCSATQPALGDTSARGAELSLRLPASFALPGEVTLGAMLESALRRDPSGTGRHVEWLESMSVERDLAPRLSGFVELLHVGSALATQPDLMALDAGVDWSPAPHVGVGLGASLGRSGGHRDRGVFGGVSISR